MNLRCIVFAAVVLSTTALTPAFAQVELSDNPFPDVIARSVVIRPFDLNVPPITLVGVITETPRHIQPTNPYQYFRMAVKDDNAPNGIAIWAILFRAPDGQTPSLTAGTPVTVRATPTKDESRRAQSIQTSQGTIQNFVGLEIQQR